MPTRERRARKLQIEAERAAVAAQYDVPVPPHIVGRLGKRSELSKALSLKGNRYNWGGLRVDTETGEVSQQPAPDYLGANVERAEEAMQKAQEVRRRHETLWNTPGGAKRIADDEGLSLSTVYAHMERLRKT
jgi:hypothetical protein